MLKLIDRNTAYSMYKQGIKVLIGYRNKDGGAFWTTEQLADRAKGTTPKDRFASIVSTVKTFIPHTRIKYAVETE